MITGSWKNLWSAALGRSVSSNKVGVHVSVLPRTCNMAFQHLTFCLLLWHQCRVPWRKLGTWRKLASCTSVRRILYDVVSPSSSRRLVFRTLCLKWVSAKPLSNWVTFLLVSLSLMPNMIPRYFALGFKVAPQSALLPLPNCRRRNDSLGRGGTCSKSWVKLFQVAIWFPHARAGLRHVADIVPALLSFRKVGAMIPTLQTRKGELTF